MENEKRSAIQSRLLFSPNGCDAIYMDEICIFGWKHQTKLFFDKHRKTLEGNGLIKNCFKVLKSLNILPKNIVIKQERKEDSNLSFVLIRKQMWFDLNP